MTQTKAKPAWKPPVKVSAKECLRASEDIFAMPDIPLQQKEDVFRIRELKMDWDIGVRVYEPEDAGKIPLGADGKKIGAFLLHGGQDARGIAAPVGMFDAVLHRRGADE